MRRGAIDFSITSPERSREIKGKKMAQSGPLSLRTYAKLTRVTDVPETPTLPLVIELPPTGDESSVIIGRHRDNDVQLDCPNIPSLLSREHAEIDFDPYTNAHYLKDNNSLNGTYVNGTLIPRGWLLLNQGDVIAFGGPANVSRPSSPTKKVCTPTKTPFSHTPPFSFFARLGSSNDRSSETTSRCVIRFVSGTRPTRLASRTPSPDSSGRL